MWKSPSLLFLYENASAVCSTCEPAPELLYCLLLGMSAVPQQP